MKSQYKISKMSNGPFAIAYDSNGKVVFIENTCPGDLVEAELYDQRKDFAYANLVNLVEASPLRDSDPPCKIHKICGSCQWQHISYSEQLKFKKQNLVEMMIKSKIDTSSFTTSSGDELQIPEIIGMDKPWNYRNKITYPVKTVKSTGRLQAGYFKRNSNELINVKYCPIQYDTFDKIIEKAKDLCSAEEVTDEVLRHIVLRSNSDSSQILLCFIVRKKNFIRAPKHAVLRVLAALAEEFKQITTVTINYNDGSTNVIMGDETEIISGNGFIVENFGDIQLQISTTSFFQVNTLQFLAIIDLIKQHITKSKKLESILDLYCGIGTISLSIAKAMPSLKITGVEELSSAIQNAQDNANLNSIKETNFICSKVEDYFSEESGIKNQNHYDVVIINPPRKGCTNAVLEALGTSAIAELIYVSCNPATLTRDIKYLEQFGFKLASVQGIDMFPHSFHFETLAIIQRG